MAGIDRGDTSSDAGGVRLPRQRRTQEQWARILDSGLELLEEGGPAAFTIPALCRRAGVPPRALYARADTKEQLLLAAYDHGMARLAAAEQVVSGPAVRPDSADRDLVASVVTSLTNLFVDHRDFLRAVVVLATENTEVARRGAERRHALADRFVAALEPLDQCSPHADPAAARETAFDLVFSALVVAAGFGPGFSGPVRDEDLTEVVWRYLSDAPRP